MRIIGRRFEQESLEECLHTGRPEFLAIYGRRRIGKTYLVREYFNGRFAFYATGMARASMADQLETFGDSLVRYGHPAKTAPTSWREAFSRLRDLLESEHAVREPSSGKLVVFLDELPWFDTPRAKFKQALEYFWNAWASARTDILLIVCGSASSWVISHLLQDTGGLHNRVTRQIHLQPFTLAECEEFYANAGVSLSRRQIAESYMIFGGVPYYLALVDRRFSLAQNVDLLCFSESGQLRYEFDALFASLFKHSARHTELVKTMTSRAGGFTRVDLERKTGIGGDGLTVALAELEQCGFIRRYRDFSKRKSGHHFQLIDSFSLFYLRFVESDAVGSWVEFVGTPGYYAWAGLAFERVCLLHSRQLKAALGIAGIESRECAWKSSDAEPGAQIDLLIDRRDGVISVCEAKFSEGEFVIDAACEKQLRNKMLAFRSETGTAKALHLILITCFGVARNEHFGVVQREIRLDDLFAG